MFDHVALRIADLAVASRAFTAVLDELEVTVGTPVTAYICGSIGNAWSQFGPGV
jgi:hypothetical protein